MQAGLPPDAEESAAVDTIDNHLTSAASLVSLLQHEVNVRASPSPCHVMLVQICWLGAPLHRVSGHDSGGAPGCRALRLGSPARAPVPQPFCSHVDEWYLSVSI